MSYTRRFTVLVALSGSAWMVGCGSGGILDAIAREVELNGPSDATIVQGSSTVVTLTAEAASDRTIDETEFTDDADPAVMAVARGASREITPNMVETDLTIQSAFDATPGSNTLTINGFFCVDRTPIAWNPLNCGLTEFEAEPLPGNTTVSTDEHIITVTIVAALSGQIDAPADGAVVTGSPVQVDATVADALGAVDSVAILLNGSFVAVGFNGTATASVTVSESVPLTTPGTNVIVVTATNATGSTWADTVSIDYQPGVSGTVSTFAGSGVQGFMDGPAATAQFALPHAIAFDGSGNLLVADQVNNRIRMVSPSGDVTTVAGSGTTGFADGPAATAQFWNPTGIAVDSSGNIYVADLWNHRIRKIDTGGLVTTLAGSGVQGFADGPGSGAAFNLPWAVAIEPNTGDVLVADFGNHSIRRITPGGVVSTVAGTGVAGMNDGLGSVAQFSNPSGVAVSAAGVVYVGDFYNNRIRVIDTLGTVSTLAGTGVAGEDDGPAGVATLAGPLGLVVDGSGNVIFADQSNHKIRMVDALGTVTTLAGVSGGGFLDGSIGVAMFLSPADVAVNALGHIFVADLNDRIRKIEP